MPRKKMPKVLQHGICFEGNKKDLIGESAHCICGNISQVTSEKQIEYEELSLVMGEKRVTAKKWPSIECPECGLPAFINPPSSLFSSQD
uniref:Uncharacterized protein n=1 Tax=candidate division CPR3 bacterium TaxID=2268181 RepID=A0A7C4M3A6_UNCC3